MSRPVARLLLALAAGLVLFSAPSARAALLTGQVMRVIDGDSLVFQPADGQPALEVRLKDIDAPEGCQAGGDAARDFLQAYVQGKTVQLDTRGRDGYGRTLAVLKVDGVDVNQRLVAEGHAWALRVKWDRGTYVVQEKMAQSLRRGLHAERGAILPSEFRRTRGPCARPASGPASGSAGAAYRCDGRTQCSQMRSCAEATWFLAHCPGVEMDGNQDGVPCERQWCRRTP